MEQTREATLAVLNAQMLQAELYAKYWLVKACTGIVSADEREESLNTALSHIGRIDEIMHEQFKILNEK